MQKDKLKYFFYLKFFQLLSFSLPDPHDNSKIPQH